MIDIRRLKELVRLMVSNDLTEIDLRDSEEQVTIRRPGQHQAPVVNASPAPVVHQQQQAGSPSAPVSSNSESPTQAKAEATYDADLLAIESPMVGTFYATPDPESPPFVSVGDTVRADSIVCLVEAMKIFNEIKAECEGVIEKILVENGQAVEFGEKLYLVRPA